MKKSTTSVNELLIKKEAQGLRFAYIARSILIMGLLPAHLFTTVNPMEWISAAGLTAFNLVFIVLAFINIQRLKNLKFTGLTGVFLDAMVLIILPIVWYLTEQYHHVTPAILLKGNFLLLAYLYLIINSLAMRPLYPLMMGGSSFLIAGGFLTFIIIEGSSRMTNEMSEVFLGDGFSVNLTITNVFILMFAAAFLGFLTRNIRKTIVDSVQLERSNSQLSRYFSPKVVKEIVGKDNDVLQKGGKAVHAAVMFTDIRGFTALSEKLSADEVVELLSEYHELMVDILFENGGTLDKFLGDGLLAVFGVPEKLENSADAALKAGLAMRKALADWNIKRIAENKAEIRQGIGIHFGPLIAGNVGTEQRLEYTILGDTVNTASRIEGACKLLKTDFLISDELRQELSEPIAELGKPVNVKVKGKDRPLTVYDIL